MSGNWSAARSINTIWRVLEKRETWQSEGDDPVTKDPRWNYAIYLNFWKVQKNLEPGLGKTMGFLYGLDDNTFQENWVIVS